MINGDGDDLNKKDIYYMCFVGKRHSHSPQEKENSQGKCYGGETEGNMKRVVKAMGRKEKQDKEETEEKWKNRIQG